MEMDTVASLQRHPLRNYALFVPAPCSPVARFRACPTGLLREDRDGDLCVRSPTSAGRFGTLPRSHQRRVCLSLVSAHAPQVCFGKTATKGFARHDAQTLFAVGLCPVPQQRRVCLSRVSPQVCFEKTATKGFARHDAQTLFAVELCPVPQQRCVCLSLVSPQVCFEKTATKGFARHGAQALIAVELCPVPQQRRVCLSLVSAHAPQVCFGRPRR